MQGERPVIKETVGTRVEDCYMSLKALSTYSGLSQRKIKALLHDPHHPIPHFKLGEGQNAKILVRRSEFDRWVEGYRVASLRPRPPLNIDVIVEEVMADLKS